MKRFLLLSIAAVTALLVTANDRFYIEDFNITAGETRSVSILLDNEAEYTAFQCDIFLPEGLTAANFALTERKSSTHTFTTTPFPDRCTRLLSYSLNLRPYNGNSGALVTFSIIADEDFIGPASIMLKNTLFTTTNGVEVVFDDEDCTVTTGTPGDVNGDGFVNVADVTLLISVILNNGGQPYHHENADLNGDSILNVSDVTALISLILNGGTA